jgi:hypothetical protein
MQKETLSTALKAQMERVHGVRKTSKVPVVVEEPVVVLVVEEMLRTPDLSWDNSVQVVARMVKLHGME